MRLKFVAIALAFVAAVGLAAAPAHAAKKKRRVIHDRHGNTVFVSRDENGRTRTRIIIQKRSYLDPGTAALPSDRNQLDYVQMPDQHPTSVLDNTIGGINQSALPGPFTLPFPDNPWLGGP